MSEQKLLSCPFCGGEAFVYYSGSRSQFGEVICQKCESHSDRKRVDEAIELWNTRKPVKKVLERLEEEHNKSEECPKFEKAFRQVAFEEAIKIVKEGLE